MSIDLKAYQEFVAAVTSPASNDLGHFNSRVTALDEHTDYNLPLLLTAAVGLAAECGEFCEIPKKILFQGKPLDDDAVFHMKRELGDVIWYWTNACRALGLDPESVIRENVHKLQHRYPGGIFDIDKSQNRTPGDL